MDKRTLLPSKDPSRQKRSGWVVVWDGVEEHSNWRTSAQLAELTYNGEALIQLKLTTDHRWMMLVLTRSGDVVAQAGPAELERKCWAVIEEQLKLRFGDEQEHSQAA